jgi:SprT protein
MENNNLLAAYVPESAAAYCHSLWAQHGFELRIVRPRRTRLGDFTRKPRETPRITINSNLHPYSFLITYLHEVAHHIVYTTHSRKRILPHGPEWKACFRELLLPVLHEACFPADVLIPLKHYAAHPKASTGSDAALVRALARYAVSSAEMNKKSLLHLNEGVNFVFQKREFTRGPLRRTRVLCIEKASNRRYTIPAHALVEECV